LILFHDTNVRERGFGVWELWQELKKQYKTVEVLNGHGLGILILGKGLEERMTTFTDLTNTFQAKGDLLERISQLTPGGGFGIHPVEQARADAEQARADAQQARADAEQARADAEKALAGREAAYQALKSIEESRMWRFLRPIRIGFDRCKRVLKIRS
jgi:multidrug resistance efflux pump